MDNTKPVYNGLHEQPVYLVDTSATSPEIFQIKEFPTQLNAGKNLFKLRGHYRNLREDSNLFIEILDYNNEPIFHEISELSEEDGSVVIVIYIYETTPPGNCTVTVLGEALYVDDKEVPIEWQFRSNVMWQRSVLVNSSKTNTAEIIFETKPTVTIQEQISVQLDRIYDTTETVIYNTGSVQYVTSQGVPTLLLSNGEFVPDMIGGTITVETPLNPFPKSQYITGSIPYSSIVEKVASTSSIILRSDYLIDPSQSLYGHRYDTFESSSYSITYTASPTYIATENSESYAIIEINDLQPTSGDISRIKVFSNNSGTISNWELLSDVVLNDTEIFITDTGSIEPYVSVGLIRSSSIIETYYESASYNGFTIDTAPTLTYSNNNLTDALYINSTRNISSKNNVDIVKLKDQYSGKFIKGGSYRMQLDAIGTRTTLTGNSDPIISFYLSGSSFDTDYTDYFNQELPINIGRRIGYLQCIKNREQFIDNVITFDADYTGTGILYYVIEGGQWEISNIHVTTNNSPGYTPNYTRIRTKIPTNHKSGVQQSFKIEYYNSQGVKSEYSSISDPIDWVGGNHYIDGDHNLVTGSLFIADKLSTGIEFSGRRHSGIIRTTGYTGWNDKNKGILIWSGSALTGSTTEYKGTGVELYSNDDNYFRFATDPSETSSLYVKTETFYLGNSSSFISSDGGTITMSGSIVFDAVTVPTASYAITASYYSETDPIFTAKSGSLATTGSNSFSGSQIIYGDLTVYGTASYTSVTGSSVNTGNNTITLNTNNPSIRYGGMQVADTGSFGNSSTGSMLWDSQKNRWIYTNPSGSSYDGGLIMSGPRNTNGIGEEEGVINNFLLVGQGADHISSSAIFHSGSITQVTGSLLVTSGITGSLLGTSSWANNAITSSYIVTAQTASYVVNSVSASFATNSITASYVTLSQTASYVLNAISSSQSSLASTASYVVTAQTASYVLNAISSSFATNSTTSTTSQTASYVLNAISSSFATNSLTASYVANTVSSSYAVSASYSNIANTASYAQIANTSSYTISASFATNANTASYVLNAVSASYTNFASTASYVLNAISSSFASTASYILNAVSASYSVSSSFATNSATASYIVTAQTASYVTLAQTASYVVTAQTASYVLNAISASRAQTASYVLNAVSASYSITSSHVPNTFVQGGNSLGTAAILGTNDNQSLRFETNNSVRMQISSSGQIVYGSTIPLILSGGLFEGVSPFMEMQTGDAVGTYNEAVVLRHANIDVTAVTRSLGLLMKLSTEGMPNEAPKMGGMILRSTSAAANTPNLHFVTANTEKMTITNAGNVGIGTTTPNAKLDVNGNAIITGSLTVKGTGAVGAVLDTDTNNDFQSTRLFFKMSGSGNDVSIRNFSGSLLVATQATAGVSSGTITAMFISSSGNVAIGNTQPTLGNLQVLGNVYATSFTGSLSGSVIGNLTGTASYSTNAATASFVTTAQTASYFFTSSVTSASFATSASRAVTASYFFTSSVTSASFAIIAGAVTELNQNVVISGSLSIGLNTLANGARAHAEGQSTTASGQYSHAEGGFSVASGLWAHAEGISTYAIGQTSHAEGQGSVAFGAASHAEGYYTLASSSWSHTEGLNTTASATAAHAEGYYTVASGPYSHAEGVNTIASGYTAHAEGYYTVASGYASHAEGTGTLASGSYSHADGESTQALSQASRASGWLTIASGSYQTVVGQYNKTSNLQGAFIIGNGNPSTGTRSNLVFASGSTFQVTGSIIATAGFTGSFSGSFSGTATSASFAQSAATASYVLNAVSASFASTASYVVTAQTASYFLTSSVTSASFATNSATASYFLTSSVTSASFAQTASSVNILNQNVSITGSLNVSSSITASVFVTKEALITSTTLTANTGITTIYSIPTASYDGAWFDYTIRSGSNARAGTIFGLWSGSAVNYAETTTTDFGSTANFTFGMSINGSNMILSSSTTTNGWTVNSIIRSI